MDYGNYSYLNYSFSFNFERRSRVPLQALQITKVLLGLLAMSLNLLLLIVLYKNPLKRFRNPGTMFIASLAIADTLTVTSKWSSNVVALAGTSPSQVTNAVFSSMLTIGTQASFFVVTMLTFERFFAVAFPLRYKVMMTTRRAFFVNLALWGIACVLDPVLFLVPYLKETGSLIYAAEIIALCIVALIIYPVMLWKFYHAEKYTNSQLASSNVQRESRLASKRRLTVTVLLVIIAMVIFMVPYMVTAVFVWSACTECLLNPVYQEVLIYYPVVYMSYFAVNPLIYVWRLAVYRRSLTTMLCCCRAPPPAALTNRTPCPGSNLQMSHEIHFSNNLAFSQPELVP